MQVLGFCRHNLMIGLGFAKPELQSKRRWAFSMPPGEWRAVLRLKKVASLWPTGAAPNGGGLARAEPHWPVLASAGFHAVALTCLALLVVPHGLPTPQPRVVNVDLVPEPQPQAASLPATRAAALAAPKPPQMAVPAKPALTAPAAAVVAGGMTAATQFFAGQILDDPKNKSIKKTLPLLDPDERIVQLCDIEGLEQLRLALAGKVPDTLEPRAMTDATITGDVLDAPGGAYRLSKTWYAVQFSCTVAADRESVLDFRFKLGAAIPHELWDSHNLTDEEVEMD